MMQYVKELAKFHYIELSSLELQIISKMLEEVCQAVPQGGFKIRMTMSIEEVRSFISSLKQVEIDCSSKQATFYIEVSRHTYYMLWNGFNEVCNGIHIQDYIQTFKVGRSQLEIMFKEWQGMRNQIENT
jgi:hypothetical protein